MADDTLEVGVRCGKCGGPVHFYTCEQGGGPHLWAVAGECQKCGFVTYSGPCPECGLDAAPAFIRDSPCPHGFARRLNCHLCFPEKFPPHGTPMKYAEGCRCDECEVAGPPDVQQHMEAAVEQYQRTLDRLAPDDGEDDRG